MLNAFTKKNFSYSATLLVVTAVLTVFFRLQLPFTNALSWDVFGYYIYLPSLFIHNDLALTDTSWIEQVLTTYEPTSTLYQIVHLPDGGKLMRYTMGLSFLYLPFFLLGHFIALLAGFPTDGFSLPYQISVTMGGHVYLIIGLIYLRRLLLRFFTDIVTAILLLVVVFGTNYFQLNVFESNLSHNYLFVLYCLLLWSCYKWHLKPTSFYAFLIGLFVGWITLIRPLEVVVILLPLLWGIHNKSTFNEKIQIIRQKPLLLLWAVLGGLLIGSPQLLYWKIQAGSWLYYTYANPGEGFDFLQPHLGAFLFSFRKGWLIYTPVLLFALFGFYSLYKRNKALFLAIVVHFCINVYLISSWSTWWYAGGSFSSRSLVSNYAFLTIPLGYFVQSVLEKKTPWKFLVGFVGLLLIGLNLFQTWQFQSGIISKQRMTKAYYFAIFGKTEVDEGLEKLLLVERGTETIEHLTDTNNLQSKVVGQWAFEAGSPWESKQDTSVSFSGNSSLALSADFPYSPGIAIPFAELTQGEYAWIRATAKIFIPAAYNGPSPLLVATFQHKGGNYKYRTRGIDTEKWQSEKWLDLQIDYLTPEVRSKEDILKVYVWQQGKGIIFLDDLKIVAFEPKEASHEH